MERYDLSRLMKKAWAIFKRAAKKAAITFSAALTLAWKWLKCQDANRAKVEAAAVEAGYGEQIVHTWNGWANLGRLVIHGERAVFQVVISDPTTKTGSRIQSYFIREQTQEAPAA